MKTVRPVIASNGPLTRNEVGRIAQQTGREKEGKKKRMRWNEALDIHGNLQNNNIMQSTLWRNTIKKVTDKFHPFYCLFNSPVDKKKLNKIASLLMIYISSQ